MVEIPDVVTSSWLHAHGVSSKDKGWPEYRARGFVKVGGLPYVGGRGSIIYVREGLEITAEDLTQRAADLNRTLPGMAPLGAVMTTGALRAAGERVSAHHGWMGHASTGYRLVCRDWIAGVMVTVYARPDAGDLVQIYEQAQRMELEVRAARFMALTDAALVIPAEALGVGKWDQKAMALAGYRYFWKIMQKRGPAIDLYVKEEIVALGTDCWLQLLLLTPPLIPG